MDNRGLREHGSELQKLHELRLETTTVALTQEEFEAHAAETAAALLQLMRVFQVRSVRRRAKAEAILATFEGRRAIARASGAAS
ncbi:hypothetical protein C7T35_01260 [Variovorax sp. WS11]|uniref:hypothetical protein n=1 Tax=Variovorax sp. WS11 TaxID=1105204 RepID=UPI000D0DEC46|nr:hypothetical protein [Variovorax sp. WS11]NDZ11519.1 hypothetical protein [Variovorax sp. WS11]PSL86625.1 hypothetical protein C7T35_01260 [Variovorax sp. WS11]